MARISIIYLCLRHQQINDLLATDKSRYFAQPRAIIDNFGRVKFKKPCEGNNIGAQSPVSYYTKHHPRPYPHPPNVFVITFQEKRLIILPLKVYWHDIGGNATVKQKLKQAIEWPLKHPEVDISWFKLVCAKNILF